jgi:hypothetical protein
VARGGPVAYVGATLVSRIPTRYWPPGNPVVDRVDGWIADGCERHTPTTHPWHDRPVF